MSEIDDIFASKGKAKKVNLPAESKPTSKKKKKESKKESKPNVEAAPTPSKKRPAPETVIDPSQSLESTKPKRQKLNPTADRQPKKKIDKEANDKFKDSRGTSNRRTTEEGWSIFKEDELGISNEGGGEPLLSITSLLFTTLLHQTLLCVPLIVIVVFDKMYNTSSMKQFYAHIYMIYPRAQFSALSKPPVPSPDNGMRRSKICQNRSS